MVDPGAPHLLPGNSPDLLKELARGAARIEDIPAETIETIWDAERCPAHLLESLASAVSIDFWDAAWPEAVKRAMIAAAPEYHAIKGTPRAIEIALSFLGYEVRVIGGDRMTPRRRRGTFVVRLLLTSPANLDAPAPGPAQTAAIRRAVLRAKPKSKWFAVQIGVGFKAGIGGFATGRTMAVSPFSGRGARPTRFSAGAGAFATGRTFAVTRL